MVSSAHSEDTRSGLIYGLGSYVLWGLVPLYYRAIHAVTPLEMVAHRIFWSVLFLALLLTLARRWQDLSRCLRSPSLVGLLALSACLVACNWFVYIHGVASSQILQTSLGYYVNPLVSVLLGLVFFGERLRPGQWLAVALAAIGLAYLFVGLGQLPWIALVLAFSFGLYGLVRKLTPVDGLLGLSVETLVLLPASMTYLGYQIISGQAAFLDAGWGTTLLVASSGVITTVPMILFGQAARRLRLSTLGFLQYIAPSLQMIVALVVFDEQFLPEHRVSFGFIWTGLLLFSAESVWAQRRESCPVPEDCLAAR
jgi:chloramphenicol-sensitive protein RarD